MRNVLVAVLILSGIAVRAGVVAKKIWTFDQDAIGKAPKGFTAGVGDWKVASEGDGKVLEQTAKNANPIFNVILADAPIAKDLDLSVKLKARAGKLDQGGGLVWRAKDAKNYYVARFNHLEDNFRVYKVVDGVRSQHFQNADVAHRDDWMVVRVIMRGDHIECYLDAKKYLDVHDSSFPDAGKVGVWSKSDAQSSFDELSLDTD